MINNLKPIPTEYQGIQFRSKLEAQWAIYFDLCGADWEYEPQGFDLGDSIWYLPDFVIHNVPVGDIDEDAYLKWLGNGEIGIDPASDLDSRRIIKNLWVEVKGVMDKISATKIKKFSSMLDKDSAIIVVGSIHKDIFEDAYNQLWNKSDYDCYFNEFDAVWSGYPVVLGADKTNTIGIHGCHKWHSRVGLDWDKTYKVYDKALNYRFDHRSNND